jgi:endonuclease I
MKQLYILFLLTSFLGFSQLTPPSEQQAYYSGINFSNSGLTLKTDLSNLTINKHSVTLSYGWEATQATDKNPSNASNVLLIYGWEDGTDSDCTNNLERNISLNGGNNCEYNREHVYAKSLATPAMSDSGPGADGQHIRASDVQRNGQRGNKKFADGSGTSGSVNSGVNWYPGNEWKGDVARIIMYMYLRYGNQCLPSNVGVGSSAGTPDDMIDLFLKWNAEDPVSQYEDNRNIYHANTSNSYAQGNRNPFIDNPYLATLIWGGPNAQNRWDSLSIYDNALQSITLFPNPVKEDFVYFSTTQNLDIIIYSILGNQVLMERVTPEKDYINVSNLNSGIYLIKINTDRGSISKKLIKQ